MPVRASVGEAHVVHGSGAEMSLVGAGTAMLVLTSPPYFPLAVEERLLAGRLRASELGALELALKAYGLDQAPVFREMERVLAPRGTCVVQTRDVRLGARLVPLEGLHRELVESTGLVLVARHLWRPIYITDMRRMQQRTAGTAETVVHPLEPEVFLVFRRPGARLPHACPAHAASLLTRDIVVGSKGRLRRPHRHQAPIPMLDAFVRAYSAPGDLVVDPYAGGGTSLAVAGKLGRRAIGYESDALTAETARTNVSAIASRA